MQLDLLDCVEMATKVVRSEENRMTGEKRRRGDG